MRVAAAAGRFRRGVVAAVGLAVGLGIAALCLTATAASAQTNCDQMIATSGASPSAPISINAALAPNTAYKICFTNGPATWGVFQSTSDNPQTSPSYSGLATVNGSTVRVASGQDSNGSLYLTLTLTKLGPGGGEGLTLYAASQCDSNGCSGAQPTPDIPINFHLTLPPDAQVSVSAPSLVVQGAAATVPVTATVTGGMGATGLQATGVVSVRDVSNPSKVLGTGNINSSTGVATISVPATTVQSYNLYAQYEGNQYNQSATSASTQVNVRYAGNILGVSSDGKNFLITMAGSAYGDNPTGTITVSQNGVTIGAAPLVNRLATVPVGGLTGMQFVQVSYGGDAKFGATSLSRTVSISQTTLKLSANTQTPAYDQPIVLTAKATGSVATPTGQVTFSGPGVDPAAATVSLSGGTATYAIPSALPIGGPYTYTVNYSGDANNPGKFSDISTLSVQKASVAFSISNPTVSAGDKLDITFSVFIGFTGSFANPPAPTGTLTVSLTDPSGKVIDFPNVPLVGGSTEISLSAALGGEYKVAVNYSGDDIYAASSSPNSFLTFVTAAPLMELTGPTAPVGVNDPVTLTAVLNNSVAPTGAITFTEVGTQDVLLQTVPLASGANSVQFSTTQLSIGRHDITASYPGDSQNGGTTGNIPVTVQAKPTLSLTATPSPDQRPNKVTLTASLAAAYTGDGSASIGSVDFYIDNVLFKTQPLAIGQTSVSISGDDLTAKLTAGAHTLSAHYSGSDLNQAAATSNVALLVTKSGQTITFAGATGAVGGQIALNASASSGLAVSYAVDNPSICSLSGSAVRLLGVGQCTVTASQAGDDNYDAAAPVSATITVTQATPTLTLSVPGSLTRPGSVTLTATLGGVAAPAGPYTISFSSDVPGALAKSVQVSAADLSSGSATVNLAGVSLPKGNYQLTATFSGDANNQAVNSNTAPLVVTRSIPTINLAVNGTVAVGASATVSVTTPSTGAVTVAVAGPCTLGTDGVTVAFTATGVCNVTASAAANADYEAATTTTAVPVTTRAKPSLALAAPGVVRPSPATVTATLSGAVAPTGAITFVVGSNPAVQVPVSAGVVSANGVTVTLPNVSLLAGAYPVTATFAADANNDGATATANLVVTRQTQVVNFAPVTPGAVGATASLTATAATQPITFSATGACALTGAATVQFNSLGSCALTATAPASNDYDPASQSQSLTITTASPTMTLTASPTSIYVGDLANFTATLNQANSPTGSIIFTVNGGPATPVALTGASATLTGVSLGLGLSTITATFAPDANNKGASATVTVVVKLRPPVLNTIAPVNGSSNGGTSLTLSGDNFDTVNLNSVTFGNVTVDVPAQSSKTIIMNAPAHRAGAVKVTVSTQTGGTSNAVDYSFVDPPVANAVNVTVPYNAGSAQPVVVLTSPAGVTSVVAGQPANGTAQVGGTPLALSYTPKANYVGTDSFSYTLSNGIDKASATVTVTVSPPNLALAALPAATSGVAYNGPLSASNGLGPYTFVLDTTKSVLPKGIAFQNGVLSGTPTQTGVFALSFAVTDSSFGTPVTQTLTTPLTVNSGAVALTPAPLPNGATGQAYPTVDLNTLLKATGGAAPYSWIVDTTAPGALPDGLTLSPAGVISGTTTKRGSFQFTVKATDSTTPTGAFAYAQLSITVSDPALANTGISPARGKLVGGETVVISGSGLTPGATTVNFGAHPAAGLTFNADGSITATTPMGDATGAVDVTISNRDNTVTLAKAYTYYAPTVTSVAPNADYTDGGTTITITGQDFGDTGNVVVFGGQTATILTQSAQRITVTAPRQQVGGAVDVRVTAGGQTSAITPNDQFTYYERQPISPVALFNPDVIQPEQTSTLTVTYTNTNPLRANFTSTVTFASANKTIDPANIVLSASCTSETGSGLVRTLQLALAPNATCVATYTVKAGIGADVVTATVDGMPGLVNGPAIATLAIKLGAPVISDVSPSKGSEQGGTVVTVTGANFDRLGGNTVTIGGQDYAAGPSPDGTHLTVTTQKHAAGTVGVSVTVGGVTASKPDSYEFIAVPTITALVQPTGRSAGGELVAIQGANFTPSTQVTFGSRVLTSTFVSPTEIDFNSPPLNTGDPSTVDVYVTNEYKDASNKKSYRYQSSDATLSNLTGSPGALKEPFDKNTTAYTATVSADTSAETLTYTTSESHATVSIANQAAVNGSATVAVNPGVNKIDVVVTSEDKSQTRTYTVTVTRPNATPSATDINISVDFNASRVNVAIPPGGVVSGVVIDSAARHGSATVEGVLIYYTPTPGYYGPDSFTYHVFNDGGASKPATVTLSVAQPNIVLSALSPQLAAGAKPDPVTAKITNSGKGPSAYAYTVSGAVPTGLTLNSDGSWSGAATTKGTFTFSITATDTSPDRVPDPSAPPATGTAAYGITVTDAVIAITPTTLADGHQGEKYGTVVFAATGGNAPYHDWAVSDGALPSGLTLSKDGQLSGVPLVYGAFTFTVTALDSTQPSSKGVQALTLTVTKAAAPVATPKHAETLANAPIDVDLSVGDTGLISTATIKQSPAHGTVTLKDRIATYTPNPNYFGDDSFSYYDTGIGGDSAPATVTITVKPLPVPTVKPQVVSVLAGKSVTVDVAQGATGGPFTGAAITTAPALGVATLAGTTITFTTPPTASGTVTIGFTLSNAFGPSAPGVVTVTVNPRPFTPAPITVKMVRDSTGSADVTKSAVGGPFTAAAIVDTTPSESGVAKIVVTGGTAGTNATFAVSFTPAAHYTGTTVVHYTLSNAFATSDPGTVTFIVSDRPDPTRDPGVPGLVSAQSEAALRFAQVQMDNIEQRLDSLHQGRNVSRNGLSLRLGDGPQQPGPEDSPFRKFDAAALHAAMADQGLITDAGDGHRGSVVVGPRVGSRAFGSAVASGAPSRQGSDAAGNPAMGAPGSGSMIPAGPGDPPGAGRDAAAAAQGANENPDRWAFWSGGSMDFGLHRQRAEQSKLKFSTTGITIGGDYRVNDQIVVGGAIGYGQDTTKIGSSGSQDKATSYMAAFYGSYHPSASTFLDATLGVIELSYDSRRLSAAFSEMEYGKRSGREAFATLKGAWRIEGPTTVIEPYAKLSAVAAVLDPFTEQGGAGALVFFGQDFNSLKTTLGIHSDYYYALNRTTLLQPRVRLEYQHEFENIGDYTVQYADWLDGPVYTGALAKTGRDHLVVGIGLDIRTENLTVSFDYKGDATNSSTTNHEVQAKAAWRFR